MNSLNDTCDTLKQFALTIKEFTNLYGDGDLGKILYSALLLKERSDGLVGFGPQDMWNTSNEEIIALVKKLEEDVRVQAKNS